MNMSIKIRITGMEHVEKKKTHLKKEAPHSTTKVYK